MASTTVTLGANGTTGALTVATDKPFGVEWTNPVNITSKDGKSYPIPDPFLKMVNIIPVSDRITITAGPAGSVVTYSIP